MQFAQASIAVVLKGFRETSRLRQYRSPTLSNLAAVVEQSADRRRIDRLRREMAPIFRRDPMSAAKYADPRYWLPFNVNRAGRLGLHEGRALRLLDLGCGPGYFIAAAAALGHSCEGVDAPDSYLNEIERRVYGELRGALGCASRVTPLLIERYQPLPAVLRDYDLITGFAVCFNRHKQPDSWGPDEWAFFLEDAASRLRPGGRICLELNDDRDRFGDLAFYDAPTLAFFRSRGEVDGRRIVVSPG